VNYLNKKPLKDYFGVTFEILPLSKIVENYQPILRSIFLYLLVHKYINTRLRPSRKFIKKFKMIFSLEFLEKLVSRNSRKPIFVNKWEGLVAFLKQHDALQLAERPQKIKIINFELLLIHCICDLDFCLDFFCLRRFTRQCGLFQKVTQSPNAGHSI
jgi:hypothetical protein